MLVVRTTVSIDLLIEIGNGLKCARNIYSSTNYMTHIRTTSWTHYATSAIDITG